MLRLVGLQQLLVDRHRVVHGSRKRMLGRQPVQHGHHFDPGIAGDGNGLSVRTGVGVESAAVQIQQHLVTIGVGHPLGGHNAYRDSGNGVFDKRIWTEFGPRSAGARRVCVG